MSATAAPVPVEVTLRGKVGDFAGAYARDKVAVALELAPAPVLYVHAVLDWNRDPGRERPALAEVTVDLNGTIVRAHTSAPTMTEAVDELEGRLRRQLVQLQDRERTRHRWTGIGTETEWSHRDLPRRPAPNFQRPAAEREVVRHKSFASEPMSVDEAAFEMDLLDHDFFLYRDLGSDGPALVHRLPENRYGVQGVEPDKTTAAVTYEPGPPSLTDDEARGRLEADGEPFLFYRDSASGEGRVLYHRYDGHYGLLALTPRRVGPERPSSRA